MLSGYLLLAMAALPQNDPKIDLDCTGKTVENFLTEVNQKAKSSLSVVPQLKNEIIIASIKDDSVSDIKAGLAAAVGGVWKDTPKGPQLDIDTERAAKEAEEARKKLIEAQAKGKAQYLQNNPEVVWNSDYAVGKVRADQDQARKILENVKGNGNPDEKMTIRVINSDDQSPASAFLRKIIANISPELIANLPAGKRVVFSTRPTAMQKVMPVNTSGMETSFVNEMTILNKAIKDAPPLDANVNYESSLNQMQAVSLPLGKVLLAIRRSPQSRGANFELIVSTPNGKIAARTQAWVGEDWKPTPSEMKVPTGAYQPSPLATKMAKALKAGQPGSTSINSTRGNGGFEFVILATDTPVPPTDPAAYAFASDPLKNEPMSLIVSESLHQYSQAERKDFIACVPDSLVTQLSQKLSGDNMLWQQFSDALNEADVDVQTSGSFLIFTSENCAASRSNRVNRAALASFIKPLAATGYSRLLDSANFVLAKTWQDSFDAAYTGIISSDTFYQVFNSGAQEYLKLYGSMNRTTANRGPELQFPIIGQPPKAKEVLSNILYNSGGATIMGKGSMVMISKGDGPRNEPPAPTLADESTEMFPNGLPQNGVINLTYSETGCMFGRSKSTMQGKFFTPQNLAMYQMLKNDSDDSHIIGLDPTDQSILYQEAMAASFDIKVPLSEGFELERSLTDGWVTRQQTLTYNQLPADFLREVENAKKNSRTVPLNFGGGTGRVKPPVR